MLLAFGLALAYLVGSSLVRPHVPVFAPSDPQRRVPPPGQLDTLTVDARDAHQWRFVDFDRGLVLAPPDTAGWELAIQRFRVVRGPRGGDGKSGVSQYATGGSTDARFGIPDSRALRWYRYGFMSHLLHSRGATYEMPTDRGAVTRFEILSYYCPGTEAGCMTLRYVVRPD
jgi:hypothetical protein